MGDDEDRFPLRFERIEGAGDVVLADGVEVGGGFVEDDEGAVVDEGAREGEPLALSDRQARSSDADARVPSLLEGGDDMVEAGPPGGRPELVVEGGA